MNFLFQIMLKYELLHQIKRFFSYKPTDEQEIVLNNLTDFFFSGDKDSIYVLKGYAGTGKTTLISAFVRALVEMKYNCVLLAPTGRAAKVLSLNAGHKAFTIHKKIYRQKAFTGDMDNFSVSDNLHKNTLFIVDEASMIANDGLSGSAFGTGRLLDDLVQFVYNGDNCRLMLIGDTAQLPPVGEEESPALIPDMLAGYGLTVCESVLTQVVRQMEESGILYNATRLRYSIMTDDVFVPPHIELKQFSDIVAMPGMELIEAINDAYSQAGMDDTIIICRSNKRANMYNMGIRNTVLYREEELESGDVLMVAKNNYFWTEDVKEIDFIANGDIAVVRRVRRTQELYGFRFADVVLTFPDYDDIELEVKIILDTLHTDTPSLSREQNEQLFNGVMDDYADITVKRERMKALKKDAFFNALQVKYAYAVTCHKAQGGQWKRVFIDQGYVTEDNITPDYYRWLYTAFTRATEKLYLVNWKVD